MDKYWGNLGLTLLAVQVASPSASREGGGGNDGVLIAVIVTVAVAGAAGALGAAWFRRRRGQVTRPRLPTHKALAKEFDCFLSCAPPAQPHHCLHTPHDAS